MNFALRYPNWAGDANLYWEFEMQKMVKVLLVLWLGLGCALLQANEAPAENNEVDARSKEMALLNQELEQLSRDKQELAQQRARVTNDIQGAPDLAAQIREEIDRLEQKSPPLSVPTELEKLESAIDLLDMQVKSMQIGLNDVMVRIGEQQSLPSVARKEVTNAQNKALSLEQEIAKLESSTDSSAINDLRLSVLTQTLENTKLRKSLAQFRLEGYQKLLDLYTVNRDFLRLRLDLTKNAQEMLRKKRDELRLKQVDSAKQLSDSSSIDREEPKWITALRNRNQELTKNLVEVTEHLNESNERLVAGQNVLQDIRYRSEVAKQQLELTEHFQNVDDLLFRQRQSLQIQIRDLEASNQLSLEISKARLQQFRWDEQLQSLRTETARRQQLEKLFAENAVQESEQPTLEKAVLPLLEERQQLLSRLVEVQGEFVVSLTNQQLSLQEHLAELHQFYELLSKKLFWRRSGSPLSFEWLALLPSSLLWFFTDHNWLEIPQLWFKRLITPVFPLFVIAALSVFFWWSRKPVLARLSKARDKVGDVSRDHFRYTVEAFIITLYLALPAPAIAILFGMPLVSANESSLFAEGVGKTLLVLVPWLFLFEVLRHLCRSKGLALNHFMWRKSAVISLRQWLPLLYFQLPWAFVFVLVWNEGESFHADVVGRAAFLMVVGFLFYACYRLFRPSSGLTQQGADKNHWYQRWNKLVFLAVVCIPAFLIVLSVRGYSFSAMEIMVLVYNTIGVAFAVFILDQVINRWFAVAERKLAYKRAVEKRDALRKVREQSEAAKTSGEGVPELEIPKLDVATISDQNRALLGVLSFTLFAVLVVQIWQDFFVAVQAFQDIVLWTFESGSESAVEVQKVTLATLLYISIAFVVMYVGVKNLPGLIEVSILERFDIDNGIRFAVTTMARYLVIVAGVMVISPMIGLDWSQLGWLVAALGVGLGFGLQEIFANFISGLIILFERPIRIGDTVTINDLSGTVSQIRMRATTITDWDQKELIIPNKTFVTNQFINWTLSDNTTRIVVKVGVAYGSNTELVTETLLRIASQNGSILKTPNPSALFLGFGASSLDFELRVFVDNFTLRMQVVHQLHMEIDKVFRELGISIAFPQLDLHVKELPSSKS